MNGIGKPIHNKNNVRVARTLRRNMTKEERRLWYDCLVPLNEQCANIKFRRQKAIGNYVVDFYCAKLKLAIELDGSQHYQDDGLAKDRERSKDLSKLGIKVIRIPNTDITTNFNGVCQYIEKLIEGQGV